MLNPTKFLPLSNTLALSLLILTNGLSQTVEWSKSLGANYDKQGTIISKPVLDAQKNMYITGAFKGVVDFDPGPEEFTLTSVGSDIFVAKFNSEGVFVWANSLDYEESDMGGGIAVNEEEEVFIHNYNGELIKFGADGQILWRKQIPGAYFSYYNIDFDDNGDLFVTGGFFETIDADPGPGTFNLDPEGSTDLFILKLDDSGNFIWAKSIGGKDSYIDGLGHLADNYIYINGSFSGTIDFDPGANTFNMTASKEYFILKLDLEGNFINALSLMKGENSFFDGIYSSCIDTEGNIYSVGGFTGSVDFNPGAETDMLNSLGDLDGFIQKVAPDGELLWVKPISSSYSQYAWAVDIDGENNIYVSGPGPFSDSTLVTESGDSTELFILKVTPTGDIDWVKTFGYSFGTSVVDDETGDIYTTGWFDKTIHINNENVDSLVATGTSDIYIQKMVQEPDTTGNIISELPIHTISSPPEILLYPNPSSNKIFIELKNSNDEKLPDQILVIDLSGNTFALNYEIINNLIQIDVGHLNSGIYILTGSSNSTLFKEAVIINHSLNK